MPRAIWKGAITFGLVHVPVSLHAASQDTSIDFDWLDKRTMDPVGYRRINKRTNREIESDNIVKGIKQAGGDYVILSEDEIKAALPKSTQTIEIERFVKADSLAFELYERPYFLEPAGKGADKIYTLLREAMLDVEVVGIARIVLHTKEHLAAVVPQGNALVLETLRWADGLRQTQELALPTAGRKGLKANELKMAGELIASMTDTFEHEAFEDEFVGAIHKLVEKKAKAGDTATVEPLEDYETPGKVADLAAMLAQSLAQHSRGKRRPSAPRRRSTRKAPGTRRARG